MTPMDLSPQDEDVATRTLIGEADNQGLNGKQRVVFVMRNRAEWGLLEDGHPEQEWWGNGLAAACQHPWQFSCWLPGADRDRIVAVDANTADYIAALRIVEDVCAGRVDEVLGRDAAGALLTHYKVIGTAASWDASVATKGLVGVEDGRHVFYALGPTG